MALGRYVQKGDYFKDDEGNKVVVTCVAGYSPDSLYVTFDSPVSYKGNTYQYVGVTSIVGDSLTLVEEEWE